MLPRKIKVNLKFDVDDDRVLVFPIRVFNLEKYYLANPSID